jgi:hypothetical protein
MNLSAHFFTSILETFWGELPKTNPKGAYDPDQYFFIRTRLSHNVIPLHKKTLIKRQAPDKKGRKMENIIFKKKKSIKNVFKFKTTIKI